LKIEEFEEASLVEETNPSFPGYSESQIDPGTDRSSYGLRRGTVSKPWRMFFQRNINVSHSGKNLHKKL
jgi:hypothetical protein